MSDFIDFLKEHRKGELIDELTEKMRELTEAVLEHGKKGSITIKIEVAPLDGGWATFVTDDVKPKIPEADREGNIMFPDGQNNLHRKDPKQLTMADQSEIESVTFHPDPTVPVHDDEDRTQVVQTANGGAEVVNIGTGEVLS